jgi:hypothetical protein
MVPERVSVLMSKAYQELSDSKRPEGVWTRDALGLRWAGHGV